MADRDIEQAADWAAITETGSFPINPGDLWDGSWLADMDDPGPLADDDEYGAPIPDEVTD